MHITTNALKHAFVLQQQLKKNYPFKLWQSKEIQAVSRPTCLYRVVGSIPEPAVQSDGETDQASLIVTEVLLNKGFNSPLEN